MSTQPDLSQVRGHRWPRRALEVAAAGNHPLLLVGPPGAGKTLLARCLPGLLPPLPCEEAEEVAAIYQSVELLRPGERVTERPFRAPHHTASWAAMVGGGGQRLRPGEVTLAHRGVLYLDDAPEFSRQTLAAVCGAYQQGAVIHVRPGQRVEFPARFLPILAMSHCPCGWWGSSIRACACTSAAIDAHARAVKEAILDCVDLRVWVGEVEPSTWPAGGGEPSAVVAERVQMACDRQRARRGGLYAELDSCAQGVVAELVSHGLDLPGVSRLLRVARTVADLAGVETVRDRHVLEARDLTTLDRRLQ